MKRAGQIRLHSVITGRAYYAKPHAGIATCGACGRSWNDARVTGITPAPAARCPFEYSHKEMGA